jgi:hypothetical protein
MQPLDDMCETHLNHVLDVIRRARESDELKKQQMGIDTDEYFAQKDDPGFYHGGGEVPPPVLHQHPPQQHQYHQHQNQHRPGAVAPLPGIRSPAHPRTTHQQQDDLPVGMEFPSGGGGAGHQPRHPAALQPGSGGPRGPPPEFAGASAEHHGAGSAHGSAASPLQRTGNQRRQRRDSSALVHEALGTRRSAGAAGPPRHVGAILDESRDAGQYS